MIGSALATRHALLTLRTAPVSFRRWSRVASGRMSTSAAAAEPAERWWDASTSAVVTGSSKGIGYEIARKLAAAGLRTVVTARDPAKAAAAAEALQQATGSDAIVFHQLDITDADSVAEFARWAHSELKQVAILVNNAGFAYKGNTFGADEADHTISTNYRGTARLSAAMAPLLPNHSGRVINVCSGAGKLSIIPDAALRRRFEQAASVEELNALADEFVAAIRAGTHAQQGWPSSMYGISKVLEASYTRVLAEQLKDCGIMVNACCPGWCATDMTGWRAPKSAADGADTPAWLALRSPADFVTGAFFSDRKQESF